MKADGAEALAGLSYEYLPLLVRPGFIEGGWHNKYTFTGLGMAALELICFHNSIHCSLSYRSWSVMVALKEGKEDVY